MTTTRHDPGDPTSWQRSASPLGASFSGHSGAAGRSEDDGEHVLVVDDESSIRLSLHRFLTRLGYRVSVARNGNEALAVLEAATRVDIVVTDLVMPEHDGRELILRIQAKYPGLPILVISGFPAALLPEPGPEGLPIPYLAKPFSLDALAAEIRRLLDNRARNRPRDRA